MFGKHYLRVLSVFCLSCITASFAVNGYSMGKQEAPKKSLTAKEQAPFELEGQWVSVITEDWLWRMIVPGKGDGVSVPLNEAGIAKMNEWDPEKDTSEGLACKAYGAAGLLRLPGRIRIKWQGDNAIKLTSDAGKQERLMNFNREVAATGREKLTRQGNSTAQWTGYKKTMLGQTSESVPGFLEVTTTNLLPGYLRLNGIPHSASAKVTEYFHIQKAYDQEWLTVTTKVEDPVYLTEPFVVSNNFLREKSKRSWNPRPCVSEWGPIKEFDPKGRVLE